MTAHDCDFGRRPGKIQICAKLLRAHHDVSATICLARNHGDQRDTRFGIGVQKLCSPANNPSPFLIGAGQVARNIDNRQDRNAKRVTESNKSGRLFAGVDVERPSHVVGLIRDNSDRVALYPSKANDNIGRKKGLNLEERTIVDKPLNNLCDVVGNRGAVRDDVIETTVAIGDFHFGVGGISWRP